jgi:hypothetical protein
MKPISGDEREFIAITGPLTDRRIWVIILEKGKPIRIFNPPKYDLINHELIKEDWRLKRPFVFIYYFYRCLCDDAWSFIFSLVDRLEKRNK